ncbi:hypothetical protein AB0F17_35550 [Nonomuraea sp. NPDC026600]|uniref:hypothetical protein n=1 Tax=Nonomuraea sp. NPDC026600 TaxID=3155363 RepID=UPI0033CD4DF4
MARIRDAEQAAQAEAERERAVRQAAAAVREGEQTVEAKRVAEPMGHDADSERER